MRRNKFYIGGLVIALALLCGLAWEFSDEVRTFLGRPAMPATASVTVSMDERGFSPQEFTVAKGARVDFKNIATSTYHWPASDLHPTHGIYPEFDVMRPMAPGETWSFVFNKPGVWHMHDHLQPNNRGVVTVTE